MCLYPKLIFNPKYKPNKKNGGYVPPLTDARIAYVPIKCNKCIECRKQISRAWQGRLIEDIKHNKNGKFITLTFNDKAIKKLCEAEKSTTIELTKQKIKYQIGELEGYTRDNQIATLAVRRFLERWRKTYKKSLRHWLITEIGHNGTENIHLHGIVWTNEKLTEIEKHWQYGYVWTGKRNQDGTIEQYVNERTIRYITKYVTKIDEVHKTYQSIILTSPGIGNGYIKRLEASRHKYNGEKTREYYRTEAGNKINLPTYWRNKLWTEHEREQLWLHKLDKQERWVMGERVSIKNGEETYEKLVEHYRRLNQQMGYGDGHKNYDREQYEKQRREIMLATRLKKAGSKR